MAKLRKDEKRVQLSQLTYNQSVDKYIEIMQKLTDDIVEINDILHGYSMGKREGKYDISSAQYAALKDRFNFWKANLQNPDKVLEHIDNGLRNKHKLTTGSPDKENGSISSTPKVAVFDPKGNAGE